MAPFSSKTLFLAILMCLLAEQGLCRPNSNEEAYDDYPNDDDGEYDDDKDDTYSGLPPVMRTSPSTVEVHQGETVALPCATVNMTHDLDVFSVIWKKESTLLFVDKIQRAMDPRITYHRHNNSLIISHINASDSGHYSCIFSSNPEVVVKHTVNVFAPAVIRNIEPSGSIALDLGSAVTLRCNVTGYPRPEITWKKSGRHSKPDATIIATSENITLNSVERLDSGTYECIAKNDQGPQVSASVSIHVTYVPEIHVDEELVVSGQDYEAVLKCVVHAEPKAKVHWLVNNTAIADTSRAHIHNNGNAYYYRIYKTQPSDFGKYKCTATNSKGTTNSKDIELTGRPATPQFISGKLGPDGRSLDVEWDITSYSPVTEYKVQYKNVKGSGKWNVTEAPVKEVEEGNIYKLQYHLHDLPEGEYLVTLRARNPYGWTSQAKPYSFTIKSESHEAAIETSQAEERESHDATAETSKMEEGHAGSDNTRPRITAILTVISLSAFFL